MITKTFIAAALVAGLASTGAIAAPKKNNAANERAATRQLNEQQLASAGSYASTPAPMMPQSTAPAEPAMAPAPTEAPAPLTAPTPDPAAPPIEAPSAPPQ